MLLNNAFAQSKLELLKEREALLLDSKNRLIDSLNNINNKLEDIKAAILIAEYNSLNSGRKYYSNVVKNAYMTSEPLFGKKTLLNSEERVELIDIAGQKYKIYVDDQFGYIWPDQLKPSTDIKEFLIEKERKKKYETIRKTKEAEGIEYRFDSLKRSYGDSSIFIVRARPNLNRNIYDHPNGQIIDKVSYLDILKIREIREGDYLQVSALSKPISGFIHTMDLEISSELKDFISEEISRQHEENQRLKIAKFNGKKQEENNLRKKELTDKYGSTIANRLINREYWIGMSKEMASDSLGYPTTVNESVGSWGKHEQWVYDNLYLHFENGVLRSYSRRY